MIAVILSILLLISPLAYAEDLQPGDTAPEFRLMTLKGEVAALADYKDNVLVFVYWKPGQKRSVLALNDIQNISRKFADKGVAVIGVTAQDDNKDDLSGILDTNGILFPVLLDKQRKVYRSYQVRVYPTTVIISKEGKLSSILPGHPLTYLNTLEGYIRMALGEITKDELGTILSPDKTVVDEAALEAERTYNLALKFANSMLMDQSMQAVKRSIESKADIAKSHILLGFLLLQKDAADPALESFNKAAELDPRSNDLKTGIGEAYILKGEYDKAIEILKSATVANPYAQMAYYSLGKAYELKGEKDLSLKMYKKAVDKILNKKILPSSLSKCK